MKRNFTKIFAALALLVFMTPSLVAWGQTTYTFNNSIPTTGWSTNGGSQNINSVLWAYSSSTYIGANSTRLQVGSKNNPQTSAWTIQTPISSFASDATVTAVSITAYTTAETATYDISVGGSSVSSGSLTTSSAAYSATGLNVTSGNIVVTMTGSSSSKAMYLCDISVTYTTGGGDTPSISAEDESIAYTATTEGTITYSISNYVEGTMTATSDKTWLHDFTDDYIGGELAKLTILKEFVRVSYYKTHCVFRIHRKIYDYLLSYIHRRIDGKDGKKDERIVDLYSILIYFANPRTLIVSSMTESDMAKMVGVSVRTIRRYLKNHENSLYKILPANNHESFSKVKAGMGDTILPNDYMLLIDHVFAGLKNFPRISARDSWKEIRIEYKGLDKEKFFEYYYKKYRTINSNNRTYIGGQICLQNIDKQINKCEKFIHFNNPIYEPGFNVENTPYPCNWCLHPDKKAYFVKGRWYHGAIHGTKRGRHREGYLEYKGLTHEIDMHNAMFYFMVPLLPDSILGKERTAYCETVKAGTLYDDLIEDMCEKLKEELADNENGLMPSNAIDAHDLLPDRDTVKRDFQVYQGV